MLKTRTCKACEGTGYHGDEIPEMYDSASQSFHEYGHACPFLFGKGDCDCFYCPACDGTGKVSERIPASDAIADAETLLKNDPRLRRNAASAAVHHNCPPVTQYDFEDWWIWTCARAAFRAVPGLRG